MLTALKLTKTFRRTVFVYTLHLFELVMVVKLISSLSRFFCVFFRWSIWVVSENPNGNKITYVNKPKNEQTKPPCLCRVSDGSEVGISEFKLVNGSRELVNYQFELGPNSSSLTWVT